MQIFISGNYKLIFVVTLHGHSAIKPSEGRREKAFSMRIPRKEMFMLGLVVLTNSKPSDSSSRTEKDSDLFHLQQTLALLLPKIHWYP